MRHHTPPDPVEDVLSTTSGMPAPRIGVASRRMRDLAGLASLLGTQPVLARRWNAADFDCVAGWGRKPTSLTAQALARRLKRPFITVEDGFLRSVGRGDQDPPLSIVMDDIGIYYDAGAPSHLERLIGIPLTDEQAARSRRLIAGWRDAKVSKYNHEREYVGELPKRFVLVIDQTFNDDSIRCGFADKSSFRAMLAAALRDNPDCTVLVKTHPDVWAGRKKGHFDLREIQQFERVRVLGTDCHPVRLLREAEAVYAVTSQLGFEALIWGKPVRCFGMPFYAGWGLTQDEIGAPARRSFVSLEQLVHAALVSYPRYIDPYDGQRTEIETVIDYLGLQRRMRSRFPQSIHALGFSRWKRPAIRDFFNGSELTFHKTSKGIPAEACVAIWGNAPTERLPQGTKLIRVEDGFLRSVGLGAELRRPLSLAIDHRGIYYDSGRPSLLETILASAEFSVALVERARKLRERLTAERLTKYNLNASSWSRPAAVRKVILVPGQVESDASIRFGAPATKTNIGLLRAVRDASPDAHIVYKPHPDVVAGLRDKGSGEDEAIGIADEIVTDVSIVDLIAQIDEVHTLTSLTGFEALIRGKAVTCYGQPFYSGWGLTTDILPVERRTRRLSIDELVAGSLILYPTYVSQKTGRFATPERIVDELIAGRDQGSAERLSDKGWQIGLKIEKALKALVSRTAVN
jgi:capsular polysaccharide export protein